MVIPSHIQLGRSFLLDPSLEESEDIFDDILRIPDSKIVPSLSETMPFVAFFQNVPADGGGLLFLFDGDLCITK
jgi:hypothetical protein